MMVVSTVIPVASALAEDTLDEIVVTAQKREQSAQDVGIAISAFSGEQLQNLGISNSSELSAITPGLNSTGAQGGFLRTFSIRGVTLNDYNPQQESPVAGYIDEVYIGSVQAQAFALFDTDHVEVLKGPQGTLFGRNATGGLVQFVTRKPSDTYNGYVSASYGSFSTKQFEGAFGGPLVGDRIEFRVAGFFNNNNAYLDNLIGPDIGNTKTSAGRLHLKFKISDQFTALLSGRVGRTEWGIGGAQQQLASIATVNANGAQTNGRYLGSNETAQILTPAGPVGARPVAGGDYFGVVDPDGRGPQTINQYVGGASSATTNQGTNYNWSIATGTTLNLNWRPSEQYSVTSLTDYSHFNWRSGAPITSGPNFAFGFDTFAPDISQLSEELRVNASYSNLNWVAGVYGMDLYSHAGTAYGFYLGPTGDQRFDFTQHTKTYSGFGQVEWQFVPTLSAIVGARIIHEKKDFEYRSYFDDAITGPSPDILDFNPSTSPLAKQSNNLWSGKVGLNWKPQDGTLLYVSANRGVKAAGFNAVIAPATSSASDFTFAPETLYDYEAGFKTEFADRRIRVDGAVFHYDYRNYQAYESRNFSNFIVNAKAHESGAEIDVDARPMTGLDLVLGTAYTSAVVENVAVSPGFNADRVPAFTPRFEVNAMARYEWPLVSGLRMAVQADGSYRSAYFMQLTDFDDMRNGGYALLNAKLSLLGGDNARWAVDASVKNLANRSYMVSAFDVSQSLGLSDVAYNEPRIYQIGVRYDF
jgi:iron complex outermembrane receptor protein